MQRRNGVVLIIVLVVVAMLALSAYTFSDMMYSEHAGTQSHGDLAQSQALTESGVASIRAFLMLPPEVRMQFGGLFDNPVLFQNRLVTSPATYDELTGYFCVVAPAVDTYGYAAGLRFGLENESAKLNLNGILRFDPEANAPPAGGPGTGPDGNGDGGDRGGENEGDNEGENNQDGDGPGGGQEERGEGRGDDSAGSGGDPSRSLPEVDAQDALMALPAMTIEVADAILDWLDEDDQPREFGAERDFYSTLPMPYQPRNGPINSLDELLLVRGVTPELLYGRDRNRNGMLEPEEAQGVLPFAVDESVGSMDLGWAQYLTAHSREVFTDPLGNPKVNLNGEDLQLLYADLSAVVDPDWAMFICAYRQFGPYQDRSEQGGDQNQRGEDGRGGDGGEGGDDEEEEGEEGEEENEEEGEEEEEEEEGEEDENPGEPIGGREIDLTQPPQVNLESILDLVGARVEATFLDSEEPVVIASPFADDPATLATSLDPLLDYATVETEPVIPGRININLALRPVLQAVPGMTGEVVDAILSQRAVSTDVVDATKRHPTWLYTNGVVTDLDAMRQMLPFITTGGDVYRARVFGYFDESGVTSRADVIIDGTRLQVPVVLWTDMSALGRGYDPALLRGAPMFPAR